MNYVDFQHMQKRGEVRLLDRVRANEGPVTVYDLYDPVNRKAYLVDYEENRYRVADLASADGKPELADYSEWRDFSGSEK